MDAQGVAHAIYQSAQDSNYEYRMRQYMMVGLLLYRTRASINEEHVEYSLWKDRDAYDSWASELIQVPETKRFHDNLRAMGVRWEINVEDITN